SDADTDTGSTSTGDTGTDACAPDPTLSVTASTSPGPLPNQLLVTVDTSAAATIAVVCVNDGDATDAHLLESTTPATHHELKLMGLLSASEYTCKAAATCPTTGLAAATVHASTSAPPIQFAVLDVDVDPQLGMTGAYTMAPWQPNVLSRGYIVVWGPDGRARWWYRLEEGVGIDIEALLDPGATTVVYGGGDNPAGAPSIVDLWDGLIYKATMPVWGQDQYTHDTKRIWDGRILSLQYVPNSRGTRSWLGFGVRLHDPATGVIDWEFASQRYVDEGILPPGNGEPYHANWIDYIDTPSGPVLYVSLYQLQHIMAIDGVTGDLLWDLHAGAGWTVLDENGNPLPDGDLPQGQHGLEVDGDVLWVYDNGTNRLHSRAEKWRIDGVNQIATREWMWTEQGWFEPILGDIDILANGDRALITQATIGCCFHPTDFVEVELSSGRVASRMSMPADAMVGYRSQRYDGCDMFANIGLCAPLQQRATELQPLFQ
ncbi:MAG: hypothetical protein KC621_09620, partial [Myxococcales bacterium]|nr:hypothetical protein [Myxococcales bacterium]